jgi:hypothetical protein
VIHNSKKTTCFVFHSFFDFTFARKKNSGVLTRVTPESPTSDLLLSGLFAFWVQSSDPLWPPSHFAQILRDLNLLFRVLTLGNFSKVAEDSVILHSSSRYSWVSWVTTNITSHLWPTIFLLLSLCSVCNTYSLSATWRLMIRLRRDMNAHKCRLCGILHGAPHHKSQHKCKCTFCLSLIIML